MQEDKMNEGVPMDAEPKWNKEVAERFLRILHAEGNAFEIRVLGVQMYGWKEKANWSGFFKDAKVATNALDELWKECEGGHAYFTVNTVNNRLYDQSPDIFQLSKPATKNEDITRRNWIYIDFDPTRPTGVSATSEEKAKAWAVSMKAKTWLSSQGWPDPIVVDSGNGYHLYYRCDLEANDDLHREVLRVLGTKFGLKTRGDPVDVDQSVHNAARIAKIPGVVSRKGENTPERPHRGSQILHVPETIEAVPRDKIMLVGGISCSSNDNLKKIPTPAFSKSAPPDQRRILSALYAIDPAKLDYQGWLNIGMALKSWDEEKGLDAWHNWSASDAERFEPNVLDDKWKSFGGSRDDKVTLGTLFHMAEEAGWSKYSFLFPEEPPPALEERIEEPEFPRDCLPPELVEYADDIAKEFGYETGSVTASMLTIASVLACDKWKVGIKPGWMEPLVLWLVKVAGSGEKKTPEFKAIIGPIENDLERRAKDFDDKSRTYKSRKRVVEKRSTQIQGDKSISIEEATNQLVTLEEELGAPPPDPYYMVSNLTTQAVEVMAGRTANKAGIAKVAIVTDEGGQFVNAVTGFHSEGRTANEFILKGYDLSSDSRIRAGEGSGRVKHPAIPVLACIQPRRLWSALESHGEELQDQGLIPRCLLIMVERTPTGWREDAIDVGKRMAYEAVMEPLAKADQMDEPNEDGGIPFRVLSLSEGALEILGKHYTWADFHAPKMGEMQAWWNKLAGRTVRVAGLLHLMAGLDERTPIHQDMMIRAVRLMNWFAVKNEQAMLAIKTESREGLLARIVRHIVEKGAKTFSAREVLLWTRGCLEVESMEDIRPALTRLEDLGYIARLEEKFGKGRPSEKYASNPMLFSGAMSQEPVKRKMELSPAGDGEIGAWPKRQAMPPVSSTSQESDTHWTVEEPEGETSEVSRWLFGPG